MKRILCSLLAVAAVGWAVARAGVEITPGNDGVASRAITTHQQSAWSSDGNVTLNGTANLAPNQTASSGSSLMTRSLGDTRYLLGESILDWEGFATSPFATATSNTLVRLNNQLSLTDSRWGAVCLGSYTSSFVPNSFAAIYLDHSASSGARPFQFTANSAPFTLSMGIRCTTNSNQGNAFVGFDQRTSSSFHNRPAGNFVGITYNVALTNMWAAIAYSGSGTTQIVVIATNTVLTSASTNGWIDVQMIFRTNSCEVVCGGVTNILSNVFGYGDGLGFTLGANYSFTGTTNTINELMIDYLKIRKEVQQ
jgi:hypothetical protein